MINLYSVQSLEPQRRWSHLSLAWWVCVCVFYCSAIAAIHMLARDKKSRIYFSAMSDGQQSCITIHFKSPQAALIFSAFVPVTPSLPQKKKKRWFSLAGAVITCTAPDMFSKINEWNYIKVVSYKDRDWLIRCHIKTLCSVRLCSPSSADKSPLCVQ